jgi:hypothetical protein
VLTTNSLVLARPVAVLLVHLNLEGIASLDGANVGVAVVSVASDLVARRTGDGGVALHSPCAGNTCVNAINPELLEGGVCRSRRDETSNSRCGEGEAHFG